MSHYSTRFSCLEIAFGLAELLLDLVLRKVKTFSPHLFFLKVIVMYFARLWHLKQFQKYYEASSSFLVVRNVSTQRVP